MSEVDKLASYKEFGLDGFVTYEAVDASRSFEDARALGVTSTLTATMIEEEKLLLGGNVTAIGKPASAAAADSNAGGPFTGSTAYDFGVSALTLFGYINGATGHGSSDAADETDARTLTTFTTGSGKTSVTLSWPAVRGAVAYNVYIGTHSGTRYYALTTGQTSITIDSTALAALPGSGHVGNTSDQTADASTLDGVIPQVMASAGAAYFHDNAGLALTADNAGGITQWDAALQDIYTRVLMGPSLIVVSAQEAKNALAKIAANGSSTTFRLNAAVGPDGVVSGGLRLGSYLNKFTQQDIPIVTHGNLPPGNTLMLSESLPYPNANVANVWEVDVRREYTQYDWAPTARKYEFGVYGSEVLKCYFPAGCAAIVGIGNG